MGVLPKISNILFFTELKELFVRFAERRKDTIFRTVAYGGDFQHITKSAHNEVRMRRIRLPAFLPPLSDHEVFIKLARIQGD